MTELPAPPAGPIRVALIGTGNCGSLALKQLVNDARFDLTGVWVSSDVKVGKAVTTTTRPSSRRRAGL
jgi:hypothetical protein